MGICSARSRMARRRASYEMDQQAQAYEAQQQQAQQQIEAQQRQIEALQRQQTQHHPQPQQHEDLTEKLKKYADLKQQGILTEEEFLKLKADLLSKL
jgi:putative oligomerization/nucleic acid binding protein